MSRRSGVALTWAVVGVVVVVTLAIATFGAAEPTPAERARDLSAQFACPQCDGQSVRDSDVGVSVEIRAEIRRGVEAGRSDEQILGALADAYGEDLLLNPPSTGTSSLVWVIPVVAAVLALGGLAWVLLRRRPTASGPLGDDDRALVDAALASRPDAADDQ
jgi:cytochrome c-type biogenesis protein CcmH